MALNLADREVTDRKALGLAGLLPDREGGLGGENSGRGRERRSNQTRENPVPSNSHQRYISQFKKKKLHVPERNLAAARGSTPTSPRRLPTRPSKATSMPSSSHATSLSVRQEGLPAKPSVHVPDGSQNDRARLTPTDTAGQRFNKTGQDKTVLVAHASDDDDDCEDIILIQKSPMAQGPPRPAATFPNQNKSSARLPPRGEGRAKDSTRVEDAVRRVSTANQQAARPNAKTTAPAHQAKATATNLAKRGSTGSAKNKRAARPPRIERPINGKPTFGVATPDPNVDIIKEGTIVKGVSASSSSSSSYYVAPSHALLFHPHLRALLLSSALSSSLLSSPAPAMPVLPLLVLLALARMLAPFRFDGTRGAGCM